ncbi:hypothetical protein IJ096_00125 [Candidatus Saccharibacteria bacterium]|nr:hypothetical protein [Candidatus Saccharibacteria bacterium]
MIDIHCHILPGVDDGSKNLKMSLNMLKQAEKSGITDIILTPHYIQNSKYNFNNTAKSKILDILRTAMAGKGIKVNLHLGNEIFLDMDIVKLLRQDKISPLGDSKYILIELPVRTEDASGKDILFGIISCGYTPIIAHPERYIYFQENPEKIKEYLDMGCLMQGDYQSIHGRYGKSAKKSLTRYLKNDQIQLLASDIHHDTTDYRLAETYKKLTKILKSSEKVKLFLEENPRKVLKNQPISTDISEALAELQQTSEQPTTSKQSTTSPKESIATSKKQSKSTKESSSKSPLKSFFSKLTLAKI